jgi:hypothetical protein
MHVLPPFNFLLINFHLTKKDHLSPLIGRTKFCEEVTQKLIFTAFLLKTFLNAEACDKHVRAAISTVNDPPVAI